MAIELPVSCKFLAKDCHYNHIHGDLLCLEIDTRNLDTRNLRLPVVSFPSESLMRKSRAGLVQL